MRKTVKHHDDSCSEHDYEWPAELRWAAQLEPSQIDALYWCSNGKHYIRVTKEMLWTGLVLLMKTDTAIPA